MVYEVETLVSLHIANASNGHVISLLHRACATGPQIKGLKAITEDDATKTPGYDRLSPEAQEQVRLALETGKVADKEFKGVDAELAKVPRRYSGEIRDATE